VKLLLPPVLVDPFGLGSACSRAAAWLRTPPEAGPDGAAGEPEEEFAAEILEAPLAGEAASGEPRATGPAASPPVATVLPLEQGEHAADPRWTALGGAAIGTLWLAGTLAMAVLQALRIGAFRARLRSAAPAPGEVAAACATVAGRIGLGRAPAVRVLPGLSSPLVWALGRPVIYLPPELALPATRSVLQSVLAHELAHLRRRDPWISWLELVATCLYWWLPTLWWTRREMRRSADEACDAWAVSVVGSRKSYAASLLSAVEILKAAPTTVPVGGLGLGEREAMERRLTMVMRERISPRLSRPACVMVALTALVALPATPLRLGAQVAKPAGEPATTPEPSLQAPEGAPAKPAAPAAGAASPAEAAEPAAPSPAPGKAAPRARASSGRSSRAAATDTESRLESLERKMARILDELEALRTAPPVRGTIAPGATVETAPVAPLKVRRTVRPVPRASATAPRIEAGPRTELDYPPALDEPGWPAQEVYDPKQQVAKAAYRSLLPREKTLGFDTRRLPVNEEKRKQIDDLNRKFDERLKSLLDEQKKAIQALTEEHRAAVKESLKNDLSDEEIEDLDFGRPQNPAAPAKK
jgi:beta-lactamase regulating signal transducer with metallopeptidase domain